MGIIVSLLQGVQTTVVLVTCALVIGFCLAVVMALINTSPFNKIKIPVKIFIFVIRGTPLLVQVFLIYYGSGQFAWIHDSFLWIIFKQPFACAIVALAINTSAYTTELFEGAIRAIPIGEVEACQSLGMSASLMFRRIIFPRALRNVLPAYSNEVIMVLKSSSLASTITIMDLMGITNQIISETYNTIEFLLIAGAIYFVLNLIIVGVFRHFEKRLAIPV